MNETRIQLLCNLVLVDDCQCRAEASHETMADYVEAYKESPDSLPPLSVFRVDGRDVLVDGWHRYGALRKLDAPSARVTQIGEGTMVDARWAALRANGKHGLRRSNADKRRAVQMALEHPFHHDLSLQQIAEDLAVSHQLVSEVNRATRSQAKSTSGTGGWTPKATESLDDAPRRRKGADGKWRPEAVARPAKAAKVADAQDAENVQNNASGGDCAEEANNVAVTADVVSAPGSLMHTQQAYTAAANAVRVARLAVQRLERETGELQYFSTAIKNLGMTEASLHGDCPVMCWACEGNANDATCIACRGTGTVTRYRHEQHARAQALSDGRG